ncbi:flagellin [Flavonifractor plautii]|uniref:flagellin N-terminal helical domain-containing protein n=1 Tax=Flavonifractor plautii TaxID=292800 RepID=UPI00189AD1F9|nr:flagellin [Flavonifractor plautii]MDB7909448.1 flagellin [Flavonifractor plautii]MDB7915246.1 flagellin [Flavonifractor plautii]
MRIQHNIMAMNAYRNYANNTSALSKNLEKLSSGYKINRAGDDAAGLAISEKMRAQITGLDKAQDNAKDGISLVQTAEGALTEVHDMLNRMYELAEQSANGTFEDATDRTQLQKEVNQLRSEINRISDSANFNGIKLLDGKMAGYTDATNTAVKVTKGSAGAAMKVEFDLAGFAVGSKVSADGGMMSVSLGGKSYDVKVTAGMTARDFGDALIAAINVDKPKGATAGAFTATNANGKITLTAENNGADAGAEAVFGTSFTTSAKEGVGGLVLQIGDTSDSWNQLYVSVKNTNAAAIGIDKLDISTQDGAAAALDTIKSAINYVSDVRGTLGATQNRLDHTINNLSVMQENIQDAESTIRDTDVADEMMAYTKNNILIQSAQAMLAQANQVPQGVLQLLQ